MRLPGMCAVQVLWRFSYSEEHLSPANMNAWIFFFLIGVYLLYSFVLIPAVNQLYVYVYLGLPRWLNG